jgi:phosphohistidine phosphatase
MLRRLVLVRHAKSAWPEGVADHDRPLAPRGQTAAPLMAGWLGGAIGRPDRVLVSTARRTRETWAYFAPNWPGLQAEFEPRLFQAETGDVLACLAETNPSAETVLVVGHNPSTQELAHALADRAVSALDDLQRLSRKFPTAGIAMLEGERAWNELAPASLRLSRFLTPRFLGGIDED